MTERDRKLAVVASLLVMMTVGANLVAFQEKSPARSMETAALGDKKGWPDAPGLTLASAGPASPSKLPVPPDGAAIHAAPSDQSAVNPVDVTRAVQRELNARGYEAGPTDGTAGLVTRAAIFAYEYDNGLALTAKPSEPLLSQIVLGTSSLSSSGGKPGKTITADGEDLVRNVKQQLVALGYQPGAVDGTLTPELARAIRKFEADQKLKESGRISGPMMGRLIRLEGSAKSPAKTVSRTAAR